MVIATLRRSILMHTLARLDELGALKVIGASDAAIAQVLRSAKISAWMISMLGADF